MRIPLFFPESAVTIGNTVSLGDSDARHISKSLRMRTGGEILLADGMGRAYLAVLEKVDRDNVSCLVVRQVAETAAPGFRITLVQALPKGDKMDLIVQKGTELGLHGIIPLLSERAEVRLTEDKQVKRAQRWQRIAMEAAKQCRRLDVPRISPPRTWAGVLEEMPRAVSALIPWEEEAGYTLKDFLSARPAPQEIYYFIGPEGGFSSSEVEEARKYGIQPVSLGPRILRAETAGLAVAAMLLYQWGDLGGA